MWSKVYFAIAISFPESDFSASDERKPCPVLVSVSCSLPFKKSSTVVMPSSFLNSHIVSSPTERLVQLPYVS